MTEETHATNRVAWKLFRATIGPSVVRYHKCDVRACVNPAHLFLGRARQGEQHGSAKLTPGMPVEPPISSNVSDGEGHQTTKKHLNFFLRKDLCKGIISALRNRRNQAHVLILDRKTF
jgi:hypothetical protein